jgi:hypothetical protein
MKELLIKITSMESISVIVFTGILILMELAVKSF